MNNFNINDVPVNPVPISTDHSAQKFMEDLLQYAMAEAKHFRRPLKDQWLDIDSRPYDKHTNGYKGLVARVALYYRGRYLGKFEHWRYDDREVYNLIEYSDTVKEFASFNRRTHAYRAGHPPSLFVAFFLQSFPVLTINGAPIWSEPVAAFKIPDYAPDDAPAPLDEMVEKQMREIRKSLRPLLPNETLKLEQTDNPNQFIVRIVTV